MSVMEYNFAILTVSDRCSSQEAVDESGIFLVETIKTFSDEKSQFNVVDYCIVPDEEQSIKNVLFKHCNIDLLDCVITTGGTGFTARDITPEATKAIIEKDAPGIAHALFAASLKATPMAMLSRLVAGICNKTLIINFPGSKKACVECLEVVRPVLRHAIDQLNKKWEAIQGVHENLSSSFSKSQVQLVPSGIRDRTSPYEIVHMDVAAAKLVKEIDQFLQQKASTCLANAEKLHHFCGHVLAEDIYAQVALPPFDASIKDGYAVIAGDGEGFRKVLPKTIHTGVFDLPTITLGYCVRISTGAAIPPGANAVVQVEDTEVIEVNEEGEEVSIRIRKKPVIGQDIRKAGSDISIDNEKCLISSGTLLSPIELGLIASVGVKSFLVCRKPTVAVMSTGDEIVSQGKDRPKTSIWDSNRTVLLSLLNSAQYKVHDMAIAPDNVQQIYDRMKMALEKADVLITTGGVSMGERDLIKQILIVDFKAQIHFGRLLMKPGKPTTFATCFYNNRPKYIFALPGNPVSAYVTFQLFVKPSLEMLSGKKFVFGEQIKLMSLHRRIKCKLRLDAPYKLDERPEFVRAIITFDTEEDSTNANYLPRAELTERNQISSRLLNVKDANGLVLLKSIKENCDNKFILDGVIVLAILL